MMIDYTLPLDQLPDPLPIEPLTKPFDVTITPPGSKSITCRAYVLAALAQGESKLIRPLHADDTDLLLKALCTLGPKPAGKARTCTSKEWGAASRAAARLISAMAARRLVS